MAVWMAAMVAALNRGTRREVSQKKEDVERGADRLGILVDLHRTSEVRLMGLKDVWDQ